jgi:protein-tyrosine phosphatase
MAERLLEHRLAARGIDATVSSTGRLYEGVPASDNAVEVLRRRGVDLSGHSSRVLNRSQLAAADLVIGMEREHVREAVLLDRTCFPRTFTLKELARRAALVGPRSRTETEEHWIKRAGLGRRPQDHLGASPEDDVEDPMGRSYAAYEDTADEIDALLGGVVDALWPVDVALPQAPQQQQA